MANDPSNKRPKQLNLMQFLRDKSPPVRLSPSDDNSMSSLADSMEKCPSTQNYHGVPLASKDYHAILSLERTFGRVIPKITANNRQTGFGFTDENGHVTELRLTQFSLQGLIQIHNLPNEITDLAFLQVLDLQLTNVQNLPPDFGNLQALETLSLRYNRIANLPESFGKLLQLQHLDLSHNHLKQLPILFQDLTKLTTLDLSENSLEQLPAGIGALQSLEMLDLHKNRLQELPLSLGTLPRLRHLDLSQNALQSLPRTLQGLIGLEILDLRQNSFPVYAFGDLHFPPRLRSLYLLGNPFDLPEFLAVIRSNPSLSSSPSSGSALSSSTLPGSLLSSSTLPGSLLSSSTLPGSHLPRHSFQLHFWPIFQIVKITLRDLPIKYCPAHGKVLRVEKQFINKIKGWVEITLKCPIESCHHQEWINPIFPDVLPSAGSQHPKKPPSNNVSNLASSSASNSASNLVLLPASACPPHDLQYFELGDRFVERCAKCQKNRSEIDLS